MEDFSKIAKVLIIILVCCLALVGGYFIVDKLFVQHGALPNDYVEAPKQNDTDNVSDDVVPAAGLQTYSNGLMELQYDAEKMVFMEMPSDSTDGYPYTTFVSATTEDILPRMDILVMPLDKPFGSDTTHDDWEALVKQLLAAYYLPVEQPQVQMTCNNTVVKIEDENTKMYTEVSCSMSRSETPNMTGAVRLLANKDHAVVLLALNNAGAQLPTEFSDAFNNAALLVTK